MELFVRLLQTINHQGNDQRQHEYFRPFYVARRAFGLSCATAGCPHRRTICGFASNNPGKEAPVRSPAPQHCRHGDFGHGSVRLGENRKPLVRPPLSHSCDIACSTRLSYRAPRTISARTNPPSITVVTRGQPIPPHPAMSLLCRPRNSRDIQPALILIGGPNRVTPGAGQAGIRRTLRQHSRSTRRSLARL